MPARSRSRIPVQCECARTRHEHGTYTSYASCGCGCDPCTDAARRYRAESRTRLAREGAAFVPLTPVREHVEMLRSHGIGTRRLATITGVRARLIQAIITGSRGPRDGTQHTVHRAAADALLAVTPAAHLVAAPRQINATGTRRRLQALAAIGWSRAELARRADITPTTAGRLMHANWCSIGTARKVHTLYETLWDQHPPTTTGPERQAYARALADATRNGFVRPMGWDDEAIDDPNAHPVEMLEDRSSRTDRLDELLFLADSGIDIDTAARRVGYASWESARTVAARHHHPAADLRRPNPQEVAA